MPTSSNSSTPNTTPSHGGGTIGQLSSTGASGYARSFSHNFGDSRNPLSMPAATAHLSSVKRRQYPAKGSGIDTSPKQGAHAKAQSRQEEFNLALRLCAFA